MAKPRFIDDPNVKRWMKQHATSAAAVIPVSMRDYGELYWIKPALWQFIQRGLVTDLLQVVRPGKEATVYLCQAGPLLDLDFLALKAYSPTMMRRFTNDATYQTGLRPRRFPAATARYRTPARLLCPLRPLHPPQAPGRSPVVALPPRATHPPA